MLAGAAARPAAAARVFLLGGGTHESGSMNADRAKHRLLSVHGGCAGAGVDRRLNCRTATEANELPGGREFPIFRAQSLGLQSQQCGCARSELAGGAGLEQVAESSASAGQDLMDRAFEPSSQRPRDGWTELAARCARGAREQGAEKLIQLLLVVCAEQFSRELLFFGFTKR